MYSRQAYFVYTRKKYVLNRGGIRMLGLSLLLLLSKLLIAVSCLALCSFYSSLSVRPFTKNILFAGLIKTGSRNWWSQAFYTCKPFQT